MFYDHSFVSSISPSQGCCFDLLTIEHNSATHDVVGVIHEIFLLDFSFEVCDFLIQFFQFEGKDTVFSSVLIWSSVKEG